MRRRLATQRGPGRVSVGQGLDAELALAVITQAPGLEDGRSTNNGQRAIEIGAGIDGLELGRLQTAFAEQRFLGQAVLRHGQRARRREYRHLPGQPVRRIGRHVFEVEGDHVDLGGKALQRLVVAPVGDHQGGHLAGTGIDGAIHHQAFHPQRRGRQGQHAGELSAAQNAQNGLTANSHERGSG